ncbi:MAG: ribonuclease HII [Actinomycetes bacterium]
MSSAPRRSPVPTVRRRVSADSDDLFRFERALARSGFCAVAGVDEAGRGACAGPLVVAAAVLSVGTGSTPRIPELADSKLLTASARERVYGSVVAAAAAWSAVVIDSDEIDRIGLQRANIEGMRRALARLRVRPDYVLSDGFPVPGTAAPALGMWKGDRVAACVAAAGVLAKVTRDRIMTDFGEQWPQFGFGVHKGYATLSHRAALLEYGPSPVHRSSFEPVRRAADAVGLRAAASSGHDGIVGGRVPVALS